MNLTVQQNRRRTGCSGWRRKRPPCRRPRSQITDTLADDRSILARDLLQRLKREPLLLLGAGHLRGHDLGEIHKLEVVESASAVVERHLIVVPWPVPDPDEDDGEREMAASKHIPCDNVTRTYANQSSFGDRYLADRKSVV